MEQDAADALLGRVAGATGREALADVDLVVEAVAEDLAVKQDLFRDLDRICKPGAILATTTSSLPIIDCAKVTDRPQDVIGMHFFNPAQIMKLVEVVHTVSTSPRRHRHGAGPLRQGRQGGRDLRRPLRLHRQRAALPLPQRRRADARGQLRQRRRHRHRDEDRLRPADGPVRAARRRRPRRVAGHRARALHRVPRARLRARRRCSSTWSPPATSAASRAAGSAPTPDPASAGTAVENTPSPGRPGRRVLSSRPVDRLGS